MMGWCHDYKRCAPSVHMVREMTLSFGVGGTFHLDGASAIAPCHRWSLLITNDMDIVCPFAGGDLNDGCQEGMLS